MNSVGPTRKSFGDLAQRKVLLSDLCISGGVISAENANKNLLEQRN